MPYESPNIVIVPTMSSVNKKTDTGLPNTTTSDKASSTDSANVLQPSPDSPQKVTNTPQEAWKPNSTQNETNKASKQNISVNQGNISKPEVSQSNLESNNSASSEDSKNTKKVRSHQVSWASNYLQSIRHSNNAAPIKVSLS